MLVDKLKKILPNDGTVYPKDFQTIIQNLYSDSDPNEEIIKFVWDAYQYSKNAHEGQLRRSGEPYFTHCSAVGIILSKWKMDARTISAGLMHDIIEDTDSSRKDMIDKFGEEIAELVEGVSKLSGINFSSRREKQAENFMKMFLSVAKDLRVIIIKFADRLHNMKTIRYLPLIKQRRIAIETRDVYAPLAHRLGMNKLKIELEDLILKTLEPEEFNQLQNKAYYFVHSFFVNCNNKSIENGNSINGKLNFTSVVKKNNVTAFQFHPEKSGKDGLLLLKTITKNIF